MSLAQEVISRFGEKRFNKALPTLIQIGKTYITSIGHKLTVTDIQISRFNMKPQTDIFYMFKLITGKSGKEQKTLEAFRKIIQAG